MNVPREVAEQLRPGEQVLWSARPSWLGLIPIAAGTAGSVVGYVAATAQGVDAWSPVPLPSAAAFLVAVLGFGSDFVRRAVRVLFATYVVTDKRWYVVTAFFATTTHSVPVDRISTVTVRQGPMLRWFGLWDGTLRAYGEAGATLHIGAVRGGDRLLREAGAAQRRGANAAWLLRGD